MPRTVYDAAFRGGRLQDYDTEIQAILNKISLPVLSSLLREAPHESDPTTSHKVICVYRRPGPYHFLYYMDLLSPFVADSLLEAPQFSSIDSKRKLIDLFAEISIVGVARAWAFEMYMHHILAGEYGNVLVETLQLQAGGRTGETYQVLRSTVPDNIYTVRQRKRNSYKSFNNLKNKREVYWIPWTLENPSFDSFVITDTAVFIFQITLSSTHAVDSKGRKGLLSLINLLPPEIPRHYVVVVPKGVKESFRLTEVSQEWSSMFRSFQVMSEPGDKALPLISRTPPTVEDEPSEDEEDEDEAMA